VKRALLILAVLALFAGGAWAQCVPTGLHYANYNSQTLSIDGTTVYSTVQTSGYATMMGSCPPNVTHTPKAYNYMKNMGTGAAVGGQYYSGTPGCPSCNISVTNTLSLPVQPFVSTAIEATVGSQVSCSVAGLFFSWPNAEIDISLSVTKSQVVGGSVGSWVLTPFCTPTTTPPNFQPVVYFGREPSPSYTLGDAICVSANFLPYGWHCSPGPAVVVTDNTRFACTKTPPVQ